METMTSREIAPGDRVQEVQIEQPDYSTPLRACLRGWETSGTVMAVLPNGLIEVRRDSDLSIKVYPPTALQRLE